MVTTFSYNIKFGGRISLGLFQKEMSSTWTVNEIYKQPMYQDKYNVVLTATNENNYMMEIVFFPEDVNVFGSYYYAIRLYPLRDREYDRDIITNEEPISVMSGSFDAFGFGLSPTICFETFLPLVKKMSKVPEFEDLNMIPHEYILNIIRN
tara:strand:+ start:15616 stop:16068 length:453 start_codon:yes stop_codon:yes gene_type:complete